MRIGKINISSYSDLSSVTFKEMSGTGVLGEEINDRFFVGQAGFTHVPIVGSDIGVMIRDGNTIFVIASETADRPLLSNEGDSAIYASSTIFIKVLASGSILISNGSGTIELKANGQVDLNNGNLTVDP